MKPEQQFVLDMVSGALQDKELEWKQSYQDLDWKNVNQMIVKNSLSVMALGKTLSDSRFLPVKDSKMINLEAFKAIYKTENQLSIWDQLKDKCEKAGICIIPLKGIIVRNYYPDPNYREMGDLDVLYKGNDDQLKKIMDEIGSNRYEPGIKHDHYYFDNEIHIEMHRDLVDAITDYDAYYKDIWNKSLPEKGYEYVHELTINDQYIFVFVHMKEHLAHKEFMFKMAMDIYLLNKEGILDRNYVDKELEKLNLLSLEQNFLKVVSAWFHQEKVPEKMGELSELLLNQEQFSAYHYIEQAAYASGGNKYTYYRKRFFPPLSQMESYYGWLRKAPVLLPAAWAIRIVSASLFRKENVHKTFDRAKQINAEVFEQADQYRTILEKYGVKK